MLATSPIDRGAWSERRSAPRFHKVQLVWPAQSVQVTCRFAALSQVVRCRLRGRASTFVRSGADFVAGAACSQGHLLISWQAKYFRTVKSDFVASAMVTRRLRGRRSTFAMSSATVLAGAALSQDR